MPKILNEVCRTVLKAVNEAAEGEYGVLATVKGTFAEYEKPNKNGRTYVKEVWDRVFNNEEIMRNVREKRMFMELDHPEDYLDIKIEKTAACITNLFMDEATKTIQGEMKILDTPAGHILNTLVKFGSVLGVSSRASGDLDEKGYVIPESYDFITFDVVTNPSNVGAIPKLVESTEVDKSKNIIESIVTYIGTADKSQLGILKSITSQLDEEIAEPVIDKIEDREAELDSQEPKEEQDRFEEIKNLINARFDELKELILSAIIPQDDQGEPEDSDEIVAPIVVKENKVRAKAKEKLVEAQREAKVIPVSRKLTEAESGGSERQVNLIKVAKSK